MVGVRHVKPRLLWNLQKCVRLVSLKRERIRTQETDEDHSDGKESDDRLTSHIKADYNQVQSFELE